MTTEIDSVPDRLHRRDYDSAILLETVLHDLRYGVRMLSRNAGSSVVSVFAWRLAHGPFLAELIAGSLLAAGASNLERGLLYGLNGVDGFSFAGVSLLFLTIALTCLLSAGPASHAGRSYGGAQIRIKHRATDKTAPLRSRLSLSQNLVIQLFGA